MRNGGETGPSSLDDARPCGTTCADKHNIERSHGDIMQNSELQNLITRKLRARGLIAVPGKLTFTHKGQAVALVVDQSIYRGHFVTVLDHGRKVCEFRMAGG